MAGVPGKNLFYLAKALTPLPYMVFADDELAGSQLFAKYSFDGGNKKWFAVMGKVPRVKLDPASGDPEPVKVINVKVDPGQTAGLLAERGFYPAFHMNKKCWVSIILDDTLGDARIRSMVADSFESA